MTVTATTKLLGVIISPHPPREVEMIISWDWGKCGTSVHCLGLVNDLASPWWSDLFIQHGSGVIGIKYYILRSRNLLSRIITGHEVLH